MNALATAFRNLHRAPVSWSVDCYGRHALRLALVVWAVALVVSLAVGLLVGKPARYFGEFKLFTFYCGFVLGTCAVVCGQCAGLSSPQARRFWKMACLGFAYLAADELFLIHENIDKLVHYLLGSDPRNRVTDHLDDLIVAAYGVVGLALAHRYRKLLSEFRYFRKGGTVAVILFAISVLMDITDGFGVLGGTARVAEEGCEALAMNGLFWTLVVTRQELRARPADDRVVATLQDFRTA